MGEYIPVAKTDEIGPGTGKAIEVAGRTIALFNVDGTFCAIDNMCLHRQGPLGEGELSGDVVTCPWHGWQYNVRTGECVTAAGARVASFACSVEEGQVRVEVPEG